MRNEKLLVFAGDPTPDTLTKTECAGGLAGGAFAFSLNNPIQASSEARLTDLRHRQRFRVQAFAAWYLLSTSKHHGPVKAQPAEKLSG